MIKNKNLNKLLNKCLIKKNIKIKKCNIILPYKYCLVYIDFHNWMIIGELNLGFVVVLNQQCILEDLNS